MRHFESFSNNVNFMMMRTLLNFDHTFKVRAKRIICTLPPHLNLISNTSFKPTVHLCFFQQPQRFVKHQFELGSIFTKIAILLLGVSHHKNGTQQKITKTIFRDPSISFLLSGSLLQKKVKLANSCFSAKNCAQNVVASRIEFLHKLCTLGKTKNY